MNYNVIATPQFRKEIKRVSKRYSSLKGEYSELISNLESEPNQGAPLGRGCFKIRLSIASKGKGTSVYLLTIFDKSEKENITYSELTDLLKGIE